MNKKLLRGLLVSTICSFAPSCSTGGDATETELAWREVAVSRRDISSSVRATGIVKPMVGAEVRVGSRVSGVVRRLYTNVGDRVTRNQLLAELDATELQSRLDQAVASLNTAQAQLEYAEIDLRRKTEMADNQVVAQTELEVAVNSHRVAQSRVQEAEANVSYARTQLGYAKIRAPITGVVSSVSTLEGETVAASFTTPTFVTILDLERLELWAYVDETDIGRVVDGQRATFSVDTYPDTDFEGTVQSIHPDAVIENTVVNYITIISIGDRMGKTLRPEMTANVTLFLETRENVLTVPRRAIRRDGGRYLVYVSQDGQMVEREVRVGWRDDNYTEIVHGLAEGETVLIGEQ